MHSRPNIDLHARRPIHKFVKANICIDQTFVKAYIRRMSKRTFSFDRFFQTLGDNTRLRLLNLMGEQEICACYFIEELSQPQPKISTHLADRRNAAILA